MFVYILALALINAGGSAAIVLALQTLVREQRVTPYDAKGYLVVAMLVVTFLAASLAYFWGVSRFGAPEPEAAEVNGAVVGMLFTVCACLAGLAYGLASIRAPRRYH